MSADSGSVNAETGRVVQPDEGATGEIQSVGGARSEDDSLNGDGAPPGDGPSFGVAMQELEDILQRIDGDVIDIDQLAGELRRATELLELCRGKIRKAEVEVNQIVQQLDEPVG